MNAEDDMGWSPLMCAASSGSVQVVRFLLSLPTVSSLLQSSL